MTAARRQLWIALADLYLDTDPMLFANPIARTIVETGFSIDEAESALRWEVRFVLWRNVVAPAGEWEGWDTTWLVAEIERKRGNRLRRLLLGRNRLMPDPAVWTAIAAEVRRLRPG